MLQKPNQSMGPGHNVARDIGTFPHVSLCDAGGGGGAVPLEDVPADPAASRRRPAPRCRLLLPGQTKTHHRQVGGSLSSRCLPVDTSREGQGKSEY